MGAWGRVSNLWLGVQGPTLLLLSTLHMLPLSCTPVMAPPSFVDTNEPRNDP